jgi:hypothetical protein
MDPFFMYVSIGALVFLILILIVVGVSMTQLQSLDVYPPTQNACPDYWDVSSNPAYCGVPVNSNSKNMGIIKIDTTSTKQVDKNNKQNIGMCENSKNFGCKTSSGTFLELESAQSNANFQYVKLNNNNSWSTLYPGISERCAQKSWANTMNITWDGVTNFNGC